MYEACSGSQLLHMGLYLWKYGQSGDDKFYKIEFMSF